MSAADTSTTTLSPEALDQVIHDAKAAVSSAHDDESLEAVRIQYLGRKGLLTTLKRGLKDAPDADRPALGQRLNEVSNELNAMFSQKKSALAADAMAAQLATESLDVTMPGQYIPTGQAHPLIHATDAICEIFQSMGFTVLDDTACPEVETEYYNFEALNFPPDHPARDMQDTYYTTVGPEVLLRSQTSNAQIRHMNTHKPPVRVVAPGRVYRNEEVSSRKNVLFHQMEGLLVDENVRFSDLKGVLQEFVDLLFGTRCTTRFRASYFPFTEPSAEMDVQCVFCQGSGCKVCGHLGWLEILGCGMVHPNVLENVGIDSEKYTGFAFGMGLERLAMLRYNINDIRLFYTNDLRFLRQFKALS